MKKWFSFYMFKHPVLRFIERYFIFPLTCILLIVFSFLIFFPPTITTSNIMPVEGYSVVEANNCEYKYYVKANILWDKKEKPPLSPGFYRCLISSKEQTAAQKLGLLFVGELESLIVDYLKYDSTVEEVMENLPPIFVNWFTICAEKKGYEIHLVDSFSLKLEHFEE